MPTLTPQDFVSKWKRVSSREKQTYQEHFIDLCRLVEHQTPNEADPTGKRYAFEMGTTKTSGGKLGGSGSYRIFGSWNSFPKWAKQAIERMEVRMDSEEQTHIKKILHTYQRRLWILELKKAQKGLDTPADILMEMEDLHENIARCQVRIEAFFQNEQSVPELHQLQSTHPPNPSGKQIEIGYI